MAIVDGHGLPVGVRLQSASPHVTLVEATLHAVVTACAPERLIGDRSYDSDRSGVRLKE